jgi:hypothetical protein
MPEQIKNQDDQETVSALSLAVELARASYETESGRRQAVDAGEITMKELEIYHYLNSLTNKNLPAIDNNSREDKERAYAATFENACRIAADQYKMSESELIAIHEKVRGIPKVAREDN